MYELVSDWSSRVKPCGGCESLGSHTRWCRFWVGPEAATTGPLAEEVEALGDRAVPAAANILWVASSALRDLALRQTAEWRASE